MNRQMRMKVAVIGAGAAGLCCARHLSRFPEAFQFKVFEQGDQVGGTWVYSNHSPGQMPTDVRGFTSAKNEAQFAHHSSMYKNLRTNLPKETMLFPDFPFDDHLPSFPYHHDIQSYLQKYSDHFKLDKFIEFRKLVERVSPIPVQPAEGDDLFDAVKWRMTTRNLATETKQTEDFDCVLICNGHFSIPHIPELKGFSSFPRPVVHSHWYREPEPFTGQNVLVVGAGPSGKDLVIDLAVHAKTVYLCNRHGTLSTKVPENVEQLPGISELREDGCVCFEDGQVRDVDCIVLATGYLYSFPFLTEESGIKIEQGKRVTHLYKHTFNVVHPSMAIIGINFGLVPFPSFDLQVQWILSVWRGEKKLPNTQEMIKDVEDTYQGRLQEGLPPHRAGHYLGSAQWELFDQFASLGGIEPLDPVVRKLYEEVRYRKNHELMEYKSGNYRVLSKDRFCMVEK